MAAAGDQAVPARERVAVTVLLSLLLTAFVAATYGFGFQLFGQLLPDMRADLHFGYGVAGTITAAAQGGFLVFALGGGWLAMRIGGARVVIGSVFLCALCLLLLPACRDAGGAGMLLVLLGGAAASAYVPMVELVSHVTHLADRGKVLGLVSSGSSYGVLANSFIVPLFVTSRDWRGVWLTVGAITLLLALGGAWFLRHQGLLRRGLPAPAPRMMPRAVSAGAGRARLAPWTVLVWGMTFLNGLALLPFQTYLSPYLREEHGFDIALASSVWSLIGVIGMAAGFIVGWISDRVGVRVALLISYACVLSAALLLVALPAGSAAFAAGALFAVAFYPIFGLIPAYVAKVTDGATATRVFAVANVTLGIGGIAGNYLAGALRSATGSFSGVYIAIAMAAMSLALLSTLLPREPARSEIG